MRVIAGEGDEGALFQMLGEHRRRGRENSECGPPSEGRVGIVKTEHESGLSLDKVRRNQSKNPAAAELSWVGVT